MIRSNCRQLHVILLVGTVSSAVAQTTPGLRGLDGDLGRAYAQALACNARRSSMESGVGLRQEMRSAALLPWMHGSVGP